MTAAMSTHSAADDTVTAVRSDTFKNPVARSGWDDGAPASTNIVLTGITVTGLE